MPAAPLGAGAAPDEVKMTMNERHTQLLPRRSRTARLRGRPARRAARGRGRSAPGAPMPSRAARARLGRRSATRCAPCTPACWREPRAGAPAACGRPVAASAAAPPRRSGSAGAACAASVLLAFGLGWGGHVQWQARGLGAGAAPATLAFAHQAAVAYAVYMPEVRHPVEVDGGAAAAPGAVAVQAPGPAAEGARPRGARATSWSAAGCCPATSGARAQFMYQNAARRAHHALRRRGRRRASQKGMEETAFRFTNEGGISSFYWVDQGFGYALVGQAAAAGAAGAGRGGLQAAREPASRVRVPASGEIAQRMRVRRPGRLRRTAATIRGVTSSMRAGFQRGAWSLSIASARMPSSVSLAAPGRRWKQWRTMPRSMRRSAASVMRARRGARAPA